MNKKIFKILQYIIFLLLGIFIFYWIYKDMEIENLINEIKEINYFWIAVSLVLGVMSMVFRALRWNLLIKPMGYKVGFHNLFISVLVLYSTNMIIPRAGEITRCTVLSKYEKIPFSKVVGTVVVERMADLIVLMLLAVIIISSQISKVSLFFETNPEVKQNLDNLLSLKNLLFTILIIAAVIILSFLLFKFVFRSSGIREKLKKIKIDFIDGIRSIMKMKNRWLFCGYTLLIFSMWLFMLYVVFLAYEPTSHLDIYTGMVTFLMGGLGMLAPVQAGIGPWHFMIYETLYVYGITLEHGKIFALISHTSMTGMYLITGVIGIILLPFINRGKKQKN